ncbi:uncharacterized protein [Magallana gigas]|uniref:uncharacterized protein n=1 Tax=Magallana gigas TaxID=29159 RepID=UPI00333E7EE4
MKTQVQDLTREAGALKERPSSRSSVGSLLTTNEQYELLVYSENNASVETAQGLEESISKRHEQTTKNKADKENEKITVHLGVTETMPILRRPKRTTARTATNSTTANLITIASSSSAITSSSSFSTPTTSAPTTSNSISAPNTSNSTSATTNSNSASASTTSNHTSASTPSSYPNPPTTTSSSISITSSVLTSGTTATSNDTSKRETIIAANSSTPIPINTNTAIVPINTFTNSFAETTIIVNSISSLVPNSYSFDNISSPYQLSVVSNSMMDLSTSSTNLQTVFSLPSTNLQTVFSLPSISNSTSPFAPTNTAHTTINMQQAATILPSVLL